MTEIIIKLKVVERDLLRKKAREQRLHPRDLAQIYIRQALAGAGAHTAPPAESPTNQPAICAETADHADC